MMNVCLGLSNAPISDGAITLLQDLLNLLQLTLRSTRISDM